VVRGLVCGWGARGQAGGWGVGLARGGKGGWGWGWRRCWTCTPGSPNNTCSHRCTCIGWRTRSTPSSRGMFHVYPTYNHFDFVPVGATCRVADAFYAKLKGRAQSIAVGDPLAPGCRLGPIVSEAQYARVTSYVQVRGRGWGGWAGVWVGCRRLHVLVRAEGVLSVRPCHQLRAGEGKGLIGCGLSSCTCS
jgi:hypothetical protein